MKDPTEWANIYEAGVLRMGETIFARGGEKCTETACTTRGPWFGKFIIGYKLHMGLIKK